jgi:hypothetical protein
MPKPPKPIRTQTRFDPQRTNPPETIELVDPAWILKAIGLMVLFALLCALATIAYFHHYQKMHDKAPPPAPTQRHPLNH